MNNEPTSNRQSYTSQVIKDFVQYDYRYAHVFKDVPHASQIILFLAYHADKKTNLVDFKAKGLTVGQAIEIGLGLGERIIRKYLSRLEEYGAIARIKETCGKTGKETKSNSKLVLNKHLARKENLGKIDDTYQGQIKAKFPILPDDVAKLFPYKNHSMPFCKFEPLYALHFPDKPKMTDLLFYLGHHANTMSNVAKFKKTINKELMDSLGLSKPTVREYLKALDLSGIATKQDKNSIFLHPHVINKGTNNDTWTVFYEYELMLIDMGLVDNYRLYFPST